jgi:hypothetical protein
MVCTGGRDLAWPLERIEALLLQAAAGQRVVCLWHGGARGADALAGRAARQLGWPVAIQAAQWSVHGASAGPIRNGAMLANAVQQARAQQPPGAVRLLVLPGGRGTRNCLQQAERLQQRRQPIAITRIG